jgi:putative aldouronate transport system substrate-binding protein
MEESMKKILVLVFCLCLAAGTVFAGGSSQRDGTTSGEPVEFTATFIKGPYHGDPNDMVLYKQLEQDTNVKVNWLVIPATNWNERKNILINSGDMPDVFYMNTYSADEIDRYGRQGLFLDLLNPIKQYAPNLQKVMADYPVFTALITNPSDGKIYSIKGSHSRDYLTGSLSGMTFIYQPWLDKLRLKMPATYLEFEEMLRAFKTKDPNGNGKADEYPYVFAGGWTGNAGLPQLFAMFGYAYQGITPAGDSFVENSSGKAVFVPGTQNFKEALIWLQKLFAEGLLAEEDFAAMDRNLFSAKNFSETVVTGSFPAFHKNSSYIPAERYDDYTPITIPLKGPHGDQISIMSNKFSRVHGGFIITRKAEPKIPAIMRWLDAHFEPIRSIQMSLGPIGVTLEQKPGGIIGYKPTPADTTYNLFRYGQCPADQAPFFIPLEAWGKTIEVMEEEVTRILWYNTLKPYVTQYFIYRCPVAEESQFIQTRGQEIENYVKITQAKWLINGGIEREWDAFQAQLKTMGVDEYTRIMQNQIDRINQYMK